MNNQEWGVLMRLTSDLSQRTLLTGLDVIENQLPSGPEREASEKRHLSVLRQFVSQIRAKLDPDTEVLVCQYGVPYGSCLRKNLPGEKYCKEHGETSCATCGGHATHGCVIRNPATGCATPLCDKAACYSNHTSRGHAQ